MKKKKLITLIIAGALVAGSLAGCSAPSEQTNAPAEGTTSAVVTTQPTTEPVTQEAVTEEITEVVTDKDGQPVTEAVTDKSGEKVTDKNNKVVTQVVTKKKKTTTTKKSAEKTSNANTGDNSQPQPAETTTQAPQPIGIVLQKNMQAACASPNVSIAKGEVYIEKGGDYVVTAETDDWHGQIIIKLPNTESCEVRFEGKGKISNTTKNIVQIIDDSIKTDRTFLEAEQIAGTDADDAIKEISDNDKAPNVDLSFPTGADWVFQTSGNGYTGVIYNEAKLTLKGNGRATISSTKNANNCICSTKSITMKNVALTMTTAQNNVPENLAKTTGSAKGIFSYSKVTVESGSLSIKSNGDSIRCDELNIKGGAVSISSSACDGVDADDLIVISGGTVNCTALEKHSFKVRRVNNAEKAHDQEEAKKPVTVTAKSMVRDGKGDGFYINGGTVVGESKNISSLDPAFQSNGKDSLQASVTCKIVKKSNGTEQAAEESKVPAKITIGTLNKSSSNACVKFLYSSSSVKKGTAYTVSAEKGNSAKVQWKVNEKENSKFNFGCATIISATNK